jgi:ABC-2 type transport system permease protein
LIYFTHSLKRLLGNKFNLLLMLVAPALLIGFIYGFANPNAGTISVGLVDLDNTPLTQALSETLQENAPLTYLAEEDIQGALASGRADYILVIDPGFTEGVINNQQPRLQGFSIQETNIAMPVKMKMESFVSASISIAAAANGDMDAFYSGLNDYRNGSFSLISTPLEEGQQDVDSNVGGIGLLAMSMLFLATYATINLIKDKENKTYYRVLASPLTVRSYMLQSILSFYVISLLQVAGVFAVILLIFRLNLGASVPQLFIVMSVFALVCVSFGVALSSLTRNTRQAGNAAPLLIMPMSMLGGLLWPREVMPEILQKVGQFLPTTWLIDAARKVMLGNPLSSAAPEILIMFLFALVFFLLGSWRRVDVSR